jgi:hypothetical protein
MVAHHPRHQWSFNSSVPHFRTLIPHIDTTSFFQYTVQQCDRRDSKRQDSLSILSLLLSLLYTGVMLSENLWLAM